MKKKKLNGKPFSVEKGKVVFHKENWKRLLIPSVQDTIFILLLFFIIWAYKHDTGVCMKVFENPCAYCSRANDPIIPLGYEGNGEQANLPKGIAQFSNSSDPKPG